jgi:hypothetical protein
MVSTACQSIFPLSASPGADLLDNSDIDFEFPSSAAQGQGFADLVTGLRTAFTSLKSKKGDATPYQISVSS